jgi:hypothetical protein
VARENVPNPESGCIIPRILLLNRGKEPAEMRVTAGDLGSLKNSLEVRDLWVGQRQSITDGVISARVEGHGVAMLRTRPSRTFSLQPCRSFPPSAVRCP